MLEKFCANVLKSPLIKRHDFIILSPSVQDISLLEITVSHHTLSDQIMETPTKFLILIGHGD